MKNMAPKQGKAVLMTARAPKNHETVLSQNQ